MVFGNVPFETDSQIKKANLIFPSHVKVSSEVKDLISSCLRVDPKDRLTLSKVTTHPWLLKSQEIFSTTATSRLANSSQPVNVHQTNSLRSKAADSYKIGSPEDFLSKEENTFDMGKGLTSSRSNYKDLSKFFHTNPFFSDKSVNISDNLRQNDDMDAINFSV